MATYITIETPDRMEDMVRLHVTDDSGRDDWAEVPRYPHPGSMRYVGMVDALDIIMYINKIQPPQEG